MTLAQSSRVLVVEDDPQYAELVRDYLTCSGLAIEVALNSEAGLERVQEARST